MNVGTLFVHFSARVWSSLLALLLIPFYAEYIGADGYGLLGLYATINLCLSPLDFGLGATMKREMARMTALNTLQEEGGSFTRTLEILFWITALILGAAFILLAPLLTNWLNVNESNASKVYQSLCLMGVLITVQWPSNFYSLGLMGLQKQSITNLINIGLSTLNAILAYASLKYINSSVEVYFLSNIVSSFCQTIVLKILLWKQITKGSSPIRCDFNLIKSVKVFALGMSGISITTIVLVNLDRIILSKILPLDKLGVFFIVTTLARFLTLIAGPFYYTYFPIFTHAMVKNDRNSLAKSYHLACSQLSLILMPAALILIAYPAEIFQIWLKHLEISQEFIYTASIYTGGSLFNSIMTIPYALQVSAGLTKLNFWQNLISIFLLTPTLFILTKHLGPIGAGIVWFLLNLGYFFIIIPIMHRRLLLAEMRKWYISDVGLPLLISSLITVSSKFAFPVSYNPFVKIMFLMLVFFLCFSMTLLFNPNLREQIKHA